MRTPALDVRPVSRFFKALGDETRLRIVALLTHGELCVCHVQEALGLSQPNVSRHLAILRSAGIVEDRRDRNWVHYRLSSQADPECKRQLRELMRGFAKREVLRRDVERLLKSRGPGACEVDR
jgi:ArsR family transcriptional regulator, arsenate/arsenite/antimonite-responsive transcriptional repressor